MPQRLCPSDSKFWLISFFSTNLHTNELQVNVYLNYPHVTPFGKGISFKSSINNANLKENSGIFGRIFLKTAQRPLTGRKFCKCCHAKAQQTWYKCYRGEEDIIKDLCGKTCLSSKN